MRATELRSRRAFARPRRLSKGAAPEARAARTFLSDERGDTVAEALVAFAVAALAVALFVGAVNAAGSATSRARQGLADSYAAQSALADPAASSVAGALSVRLETYAGAPAPASLAPVPVEVFRAGDGASELVRFGPAGEVTP